MTYVQQNFQTKKMFKKFVELEAHRQPSELAVFNPSGIFPAKQNGRDVIEGPHYPQPHRWYAEVEVENGFVKRVIA